VITVLFDHRSGVNDYAADDRERLLTRVFEAGLAHLGYGAHYEISISFVAPEEIRALNKEYRNTDRATDVLSFPFFEEAPRKIQKGSAHRRRRRIQRSSFQKRTPGISTVKAAEVSGADSPALGDIVICPAAARAQALEYGHSETRELAFLALHGLLHLLGYDHQTPEAEKEMTETQEAILQSVGITRAAAYT
jgi:probable rRNA maturation factor